MAFPIGWQRSCPLTITQAKVYEDSLASFPVLITAGCLPAEMVTLAGANAAQSNGGDIRFSSDASGLSQLACEVVKWTQNATPANAVAEIYVNVPTISGVTDTVIYVWYKGAGGLSQPAANAAFGSQAVWNSDIKGVWHLGDGATLALTDSTANANNGTNHSATATTGKFGGGAAFNGSSQYIDLGTGASLAITKTMTVQAWIKAAVSQSGFPQIVARGDSGGITGFNLYLQGTTYYGAMILKEGSGAWGTSFAAATASALNDNAWHFLVGVYAGAYVFLYLDGVQVANDAASGIAVNYGTSPSAMIGSKPPLTSAYFSGVIDEARITAAPRSGGWVATEYANQNSPTTFVVAGTAYAPGAYAEPSGFYGRQFR